MITRVIIIVLIVFLALLIVLPLILNSLGVPILSRSGGGSAVTSDLRDAMLVFSSDGGGKWQVPEFVHEKKEALPSGILDIAFDPREANTLFMGTRGAGLWKSVDGGAHWSRARDRDGVIGERSDVYKVAISRSRPEVMYLAVFQNSRGRVLKSDDGGAVFREIYAVTQNRYGVFDVYVSPFSPAEAMIATGEGRLLETRNSGATWRIAHTFLEPVVRIAVNPAFPGERYAVTSSGTISHTFDGGHTWMAVKNAGDSGSVASNGEIHHPYENWGFGFSSSPSTFDFAIDPANPAMLYLVRGNLLSASSDGGLSWKKITTLIAGKGTALGGVAAHPNDSHTFFVTAGSDFYRSNDSGATWSVKMLGTQRPLKKIFVNPRRADSALVTVGR